MLCVLMTSYLDLVLTWAIIQWLNKTCQCRCCLVLCLYSCLGNRSFHGVQCGCFGDFQSNIAHILLQVFCTPSPPKSWEILVPSMSRCLNFWSFLNRVAATVRKSRKNKRKWLGLIRRREETHGLDFQCLLGVPGQNAYAIPECFYCSCFNPNTPLHRWSSRQKCVLMAI